MIASRQTLNEINQSNRRFWLHQRALLQDRMANEAVRVSAFEVMEAQQLQGMPLRHRATLERALEDVERIRHRSLLQQARKGGRATKTDALQSLIERIVARRPSISAEQLLDALGDHERIPPIQDIVDGVIEFTDHKGAGKNAPISGLKDRLSRAKKKIRSR
jgi:hypothetical protein